MSHPKTTMYVMYVIMYVYTYTSTDDEQHHAMHYKKHENEKIIHCFDPKNGCFAIHVPTTTEL